MPAKHHYAKVALGEGLFWGLSTFSQLENRISALPTRKERGDAFEVFAEAYLATQGIALHNEVWPAQSVPIDILKQLSLPDTDQGVDGVYRANSGELHAYQVKFRSRRRRLLWGKELSTFMGLTDQATHRRLFTNCDDLPDLMNERSRFSCTRGNDLDRLEGRDFEAIHEWLETGRTQIQRKEPREHQEEALEAILKGISDNDRATAVMACGTGKTLVALWLAEKTAHKRIIVLVPSLALIRQTLHEWLRETSWENPQFLCVCSDKSVAKGADDIIVQQADLDFPVTTDAAEAREFLSRDTNSVQVVFTTYQSSRVVGEAMEGLPAFNLGIFDEAHKTAGRESTNFAFALRDENLRIGKRVFLTATPRHYDVRKKDKEGDLKTVFSMDDEATYGPIVYTLPFAEAARRGIICDYKVIISVVTSEMVNDDLLRHGEVVVDGEVVNARQVAHQIALQKACEEHQLRKVFTFHSTVKAAREFTGDGNSAISTHLPDYRTNSVSGDMPTAKREGVLRAFREADQAILSNARCLTEGVDVPAVDMVAFMSPKKSKVDIVQATGRAMRKAEGKDIGYIMVPLYVETAAGEEIEEALERTDFGDVWDLLQAMREQDDVLNDIIGELRVEKGRSGSVDDNRIRERIEVLGPEIGLDQLRHSIAVTIVDRLGLSWDERFGELIAYKECYGDTNVPTRWGENPNLGQWVRTQRSLRKQGGLGLDRISKLENLGFDWSVRAPWSDVWECRYSELVEFENMHGHCNVPPGWPENPQLARWVRKQRANYNAGQLSPDRIKRLENLGYIWEPYAAAWEEMYAMLLAYKAKHGDCNVPKDYSEKSQLGTWVDTQRQEYKLNKVSADRITRLEDVGFVWDPWSASWEEMFEELLAYKVEHGDCNVPEGYQKNPKLAKWVMHRRRAYRLGNLKQELITRLEDVGFVWDPKSEAWENMLKALVAYKAEHGDCNVSSHYQKDPKLGSWVKTQRKFYKSGDLNPDRIKRLEDIGFEWSRR